MQNLPEGMMIYNDKNILFYNDVMKKIYPILLNNCDIQNTEVIL